MESLSTDTLGGFKAVGEGGVLGSIPPIAGAVANALAGLGVNANHIPLSPDRGLDLIERAFSHV